MRAAADARQDVPNRPPRGSLPFEDQELRRGGEPTAQEFVSDAGHLWKVRATSAAEMDQLRIRVIALESLVVSLLAQASDRERELAREMAAYIRPRPGFTAHRPTTHAATRMLGMLDRAEHLRAVTPASDTRALGAAVPHPDESAC